jgi:hypothetical protein
MHHQELTPKSFELIFYYCIFNLNLIIFNTITNNASQKKKRITIRINSIYISSKECIINRTQTWRLQTSPDDASIARNILSLFLLFFFLFFLFFFILLSTMFTAHHHPGRSCCISSNFLSPSTKIYNFNKCILLK